ncbi:family 20 glycosylhydrolase [Hymenobacter sp. ASUV-10]|uniref:Family 20 glycosylhydrolase n=1 Tax=Hymenobacter aranciens TaxID=3063996 RepID=A0ABT9BF82_9BACT|nr:family 20 glycosylhydrolase [Hymenobacter sp. ASUV-10]MDO7876933.1 family 20 glycosylhydrolase [Hymenobacter sp. ASUV-10]
MTDFTQRFAKVNAAVRKGLQSIFSAPRRLSPARLGGNFFLLCLLFSCSAKAHNLLPAPTEMSWGKGRLNLKTQLRLELPATADSNLRKAAEQALTFIQGPGKPVSGPLLQIRYGRVGLPEKLDEERYSLRVTPMGVSIDAPTSLGVLRALATLRQLPVTEKKLRYLPEVDIRDQPRFAWRGLLMDAARHFMPLPVIKRNLDGMAAVKLNVLHWHLCDDQGWRVESRLFPRLHTVAGANGYYTQAEVREVVRYAAARGIRVVPEFDLPGHAGALVTAYPRLASNDSVKTLPVRWGVLNIAIDPTRESTYTMLDSLLTEMSGLFPDPYFHVGGDENDGRQWRRNPRIVSFMREHRMFKADSQTVDKHRLQTYFNRRILPTLQRNGKIMVGWDEILGADLPKEVVIQSWSGKKGVTQAVQLGHPTILSNGYYIDLNFPAATHYTNDPLPAGTTLTPEQQRLVLGGEATMWAEFADSVMVDSRIWPRAAAVAERLWSAQAATQDVPDMYRRLNVVSVELDRLGLRHRRVPPLLLQQMAVPFDAAPLRTLAEVLEPVKEYKRHFQGFKYTTETPLNRLVDAAPAESEVARRFAMLVDSVVAGGGPLQTGAGRQRQLMSLRTQLLLWQANETSLTPILALNPALGEYAPLSSRLTAVSKLLLERLVQLEKGQTAPARWVAGAKATLDDAQKPAGQAELAIVKAARKLAGI